MRSASAFALTLLLLATLGAPEAAATTSAPRAPGAISVEAQLERLTEGAPQLARKRKKKRKKKKSKRQRRKEAAAKKKAEAEAKKKAEAEAKRQAEEQARLAAEAEAKRKAEEAEAARRAALPVLAVLPLGGTEISLSDLSRLNQSLRAALEATDRFVVQDQQATDEMVTASQSLGIDCALATEACASQLGQMAGARYAVVGQVVFLPSLDDVKASAASAADTAATDGPSILTGQLGVHLALLPLGEQQGEGRWIRALITSDPSQQDQALAPVLQALLDDQAPLGSMPLEIQPAGAEVTLDGLALGAAPVTTPGGLLPGTHRVRVTQEGYLPRELSVQVGAGPQQVLVALEEDESLHKERGIAWWEIAAPWSVFGVGAVAAFGGLGAVLFASVTLALALQTSSAIDALDGSAANFPQEAGNAWQQNAVWRELYNAAGPYAFAAGGVFLAAGGLLAASGAGWGSYYFIADRTADDRGE